MKMADGERFGTGEQPTPTRAAGFVAPDVGRGAEIVASPGGHVLDSVPGLYRDVLSFDFRSLYPSIIRTFRIDPLGLFQPGDDPLPGEAGATRGGSAQGWAGRERRRPRAGRRPPRSSGSGRSGRGR